MNKKKQKNKKKNPNLLVSVFLVIAKYAITDFKQTKLNSLDVYLNLS